MNQINKLLKPNGVLYIATKGGEGEHIENEHLDDNLKMFETYFELEEIENLLKQNNFEIIDAQKVTKREGAEVEENSGYAVVIFARRK